MYVICNLKCPVRTIKVFPSYILLLSVRVKLYSFGLKCFKTLLFPTLSSVPNTLINIIPVDARFYFDHLFLSAVLTLTFITQTECIWLHTSCCTILRSCQDGWDQMQIVSLMVLLQVFKASQTALGESARN